MVRSRCVHRAPKPSAIAEFLFVTEGINFQSAGRRFTSTGIAAVGRLLQRQTGPIFHLIEDLFGQSIVEVHRNRRGIDFAGAGQWTQGKGRNHHARSTTHLQARDRQGAQVAINTHPAADFAIR